MNTENRVSPQAPEIEEAIIGACLIEQGAIPLVADKLRPEMFYVLRHQVIYAAILAMYHAFLSPNLFTDIDGRYLGMDLKVHTTDKEDPVYTTFFYLGHISCVASFAHHHRPSYQRKLYPFIVEETA